MKIERSTQVEGIWGYEQLARLPMRSRPLFLLIMGGSLAFHGLFALFLADVRPGTAFAEIATQGQMRAWFLGLGGLGAIMIYTPITGARWVRDRVVAPLAAIDPDVEAHGGELRPRVPQVLGISLAATLVSILVIRLLALEATGIDLFDVPQLFTQGPGPVVSNFVLGPIFVFVTSIAAAVGAIGGVRHGTAIARNIRLDILRVEDYSNLADNAVANFVILCIVLSVGAVFSLQNQSDAMQAFLLYAALLAMLTTSAMVLYTSRPVLVLAARMRAEIAAEKARVLALLDGGDPELLALTRPGWVSMPPKGELLAYLAVLKSLSPWPIGQKLRTLVLFGFLPPFSWFMAATVENLAY